MRAKPEKQKPNYFARTFLLLLIYRVCLITSTNLFGVSLYLSQLLNMILYRFHVDVLPFLSLCIWQFAPDPPHPPLLKET